MFIMAIGGIGARIEERSFISNFNNFKSLYF